LRAVLLLTPLPPHPPLFPYTTLFRSACPVQVLEHEDQRMTVRQRFEESAPRRERVRALAARLVTAEAEERTQLALDPTPIGLARSEEHTSELQSPYDIVCRLLLEKKQ